MAWLLVNGHVHIINTPRPLLCVGEVAISAWHNVSRTEYERVAAFAKKLGITVPQVAGLHRNGLVGTVKVLGHLDEHPSPWFTGPCALLVTGAQPRPFVSGASPFGVFEITRPREWA